MYVKETEIQVRIADLDPMGHVSNNVYGEYFELARVDWFEHFHGDNPDSVIANININFIAEINFKDHVYVKTKPLKKGNKSITLLQDIYANGCCVTKATVVLVGFNKETRESCLILPGWEC